MLEGHWCASVDATIHLRTGCNDKEKIAPQLVVVHVDAWAPVDAISNPHDIREVIDYELIFLAIRRLENDAHCECLESSILTLMTEVFAIPVVNVASVSMRKPEIYGELATPAISLRLSRSQWENTASKR